MKHLVGVAISIQTCGAPDRSGLIELVGNVVDLGYNLQKPTVREGGDVMRWGRGKQMFFFFFCEMGFYYIYLTQSRKRWAL
ncbi:hypothetical protein BHE74_00041064 [Ensete ventricosum]|nr:hypothetical protein BHE74_00041064 [Ensete ventricosum]